MGLYFQYLMSFPSGCVSIISNSTIKCVSSLTDDVSGVDLINSLASLVVVISDNVVFEDMAIILGFVGGEMPGFNDDGVRKEMQVLVSNQKLSLCSIDVHDEWMERFCSYKRDLNCSDHLNMPFFISCSYTLFLVEKDDGFLNMSNNSYYPSSECVSLSKYHNYIHRNNICPSLNIRQPNSL